MDNEQVGAAGTSNDNEHIVWRTPEFFLGCEAKKLKKYSMCLQYNDSAESNFVYVSKQNPKKDMYIEYSIFEFKQL